jgi:hypothetical protein
MVRVKAIPERAKRLAIWSACVDAVFVEHPEVLMHMPDDFILVTLPQEEPELTAYALNLAPKQADKAIVYALVWRDSVTFLLPEGPLQADLKVA